MCVVRQHYVPRDSRVARAVHALVARGFDVDVLCLRAPGEPVRERHGRLRIHRLPLRHHPEAGPLGYVVEYAVFGLAATVLVALAHVVRRYRVVQIHSVPDVLVLAGVVPRLLGAKVLLDLQECMPEFFATKFAAGAGHPAVALLARLEQAAIVLADHVITPTDQMRATFLRRGAEADRITTVMDGADPAVFAVPRPRTPVEPDRFTLVSHGTVEEHYGLDTALRAVALLRDRVPGLRLEIYGDGSALPGLRRLADELGVADLVSFSGGFVPMADLVDALARADVGVLAVRRDPFRDVALPGKIFDFVVMGLPVVSSRTRSMTETFGDAVEPFDSDDAEGLARAVLALHRSPARRAALVARARERAEPLSWDRQRDRYLATVVDLVEGRPVGRYRSRAASRRLAPPCAPVRPGSSSRGTPREHPGAG